MSHFYEKVGHGEGVFDTYVPEHKISKKNRGKWDIGIRFFIYMSQTENVEIPLFVFYFWFSKVIAKTSSRRELRIE